MTTLYQRNGGTPNTLPERIRLPDGRTRTHLSALSADALADLGFVPAPVQPSYNPATEICRWVGSEWVVIARPPPSSVTMAQARRALHRAGLLVTVQAAIDAADEETRIAWEYGQSVDRASPMVTTIAAGLSLTEAQIDDLFRTAAAIV